MARALDERFVAKELSADALAAALEPAVSLSDADRAAYAERARKLLALHSHEELRRRMEDEVLPVLLAS
jgi:hypothetical protein